MSRSAHESLRQALDQHSHKEGGPLLAEKRQRQQRAAHAPEEVESSGEWGTLIPAHRPSNDPDDKVRRYLVYLKYWTLNLMHVMVYPVLLPPTFTILER